MNKLKKDGVRRLGKLEKLRQGNEELLEPAVISTQSKKSICFI